MMLIFLSKNYLLCRVLENTLLPVPLDCCLFIMEGSEIMATYFLINIIIHSILIPIPCLLCWNEFVFFNTCLYCIIEYLINMHESFFFFFHNAFAMVEGAIPVLYMRIWGAASLTRSLWLRPRKEWRVWVLSSSLTISIFPTSSSCILFLCVHAVRIMIALD